MGLPVKKPIEVESLEASFLAFLTYTFTELLVGAQDNYFESGKIALPTEHEAAILVQHDRTDYRSWMLPQTEARPKICFATSHVFSLVVIHRDKSEAYRLLKDMRASLPCFYPFEQPSWLMFPSSEQYDGEFDSLHHFTAFYCMEEAALPSSESKQAAQ